jgi:hypothetical protein
LLQKGGAVGSKRGATIVTKEWTHLVMPKVVHTQGKPKNRTQKL